MITVLDHDRAQLFCGGALELLESLPDKSVDAVITDPPYSAHTHKNLGKESRGDGYANRKALSFEHLEGIDIQEFAKEFVRVSSGWILVFTDDRSVPDWGNALEANGARWVRTGHWVKNNPMPQMSGDRPAVGTEPIVIAYAQSGKMKWNAGGKAAVWRGPVDRLDHVHPTQKPIWLMQRLAGAFVPPGGLVLDPFVGSGSTLVGALISDRRVVPGETAPDCACKVDISWPIPVGLSGMGSDLDGSILEHAARRVKNALDSQPTNDHDAGHDKQNKEVEQA